MSDTFPDARRRVTLSLLTLCTFFFILGGLAVGCSRPNKSEARFTVSSVKTLEPRAIDEARKWRADAYLSSVSMYALAVDSRTPPATDDLLSFGFESRSDPQHSYEVAFLLNGKIELRDWYISRPYLDFVPIEPTDWTIDSTDAWRIAQENGGNEFLRKNQTGVLSAFLSLERWNPPRSGSALWYVSYFSRATSQQLRFLIDDLGAHRLDPRPGDLQLRDLRPARDALPGDGVREAAGDARAAPDPGCARPRLGPVGAHDRAGAARRARRGARSATRSPSPKRRSSCPTEGSSRAPRPGSASR